MTIPPEQSDRIFATQPVQPKPTAPTFSGAAGQGTAAPFTLGQAPPVPPGAQVPLPGAALPSTDSLVAQIGTSQDSWANMRNQLNTKDLEFKRSQRHLLRNKLSDANNHLKAVNEKLGVEVPPTPARAGARPVERFLGLITDGENQLASAKAQILTAQAKPDQIRPADLLLMQVKLTQAQQEIEYASALLAKVVESIKATMSIQL